MTKAFKVVDEEQGSLLVISRSGEAWKLQGTASIGDVLYADQINEYAWNWKEIGFSGTRVPMNAPASVIADIWGDN